MRPVQTGRPLGRTVAALGQPARRSRNEPVAARAGRVCRPLKPDMAQVFSLREVAGLETEEICKELDITPTNCWVLLHRARLFMRQCLELNGFTKAGAA